jgi:hypothetical protein
MDEVSFLQRAERGLTSIKQLGLYKLLFSQKVAFCFVILFIMTGVVAFSSWAVVKHYLDPATYGTVIVTFGGIVATLAGIYNIVHGMNDRAALAAQAAMAGQAVPPPPPPPVVAVPLPPPPPDANLPPNGTL